jgi:nicotinic acid mononucleotide adenylyltransferase
MAAPGPPRLEVVGGALRPGAATALLAGSFNPITRAHAALAAAGHRSGRELVVLTMAPVSLDKEGVERAHPVDRLDWVRAWARPHPWAVVAVASHPLLVDMAEPLARLTGAEVALLVGTDKAAQLVDPRYYEDLDAAIQRLDQAASLLVAERAGHPAAALPLRAAPLPTPEWTPGRSSTEAREAARRGEPLDGLVPSAVARAIRRTGAYDEDAGPYLARARELDRLVDAGAAGTDSLANGPEGLDPDSPSGQRRGPRAIRGGQDSARGLVGHDTANPQHL